MNSHAHARSLRPPRAPLQAESPAPPGSEHGDSPLYPAARPHVAAHSARTQPRTAFAAHAEPTTRPASRGRVCRGGGDSVHGVLRYAAASAHGPARASMPFRSRWARIRRTACCISRRL